MAKKKAAPAKPKAPPAAAPVAAPGDFWNAENCWGLAGRVLCHFAGKKEAPGWAACYERYLDEKSPVLSALSAETGRVKTGRAEADLGGQAGTPQDSWGRLYEAARPYGLHDKLSWLDPYEAHVGQIRDEKPCAAVKKGMKLGRALTAFFLEFYGDHAIDGSGMAAASEGWKTLLSRLKIKRSHAGRAWRNSTNAEAVAALVTDLSEKCHPPAGGKLVLSCNPLDLLLLSESACFTSCQSLRDGLAHRGGAQQYLYDGHTAVAYYYREERDYKPAGVKLPYKLWRQLCHLDLKRGRACLMRQYPGPQARPVGLPEALDRLVARALAGHEAPAWSAREATDRDNSPVLYPDQDDDDEDDEDEGGHRLAYVDGFAAHKGRLVTLGPSLKAPSLVLAETTPCPFCEGGRLTQSALLGCDRCSGQLCHFCEAALARGAGVTCPGGKTACAQCWCERYFCCQDCHDPRDVATRVKVDACPGPRDVCAGCAKGYKGRCTSCQKPIPTAGYRPRAGSEPLCAECWGKAYYLCRNCGQDGPLAEAKTAGLGGCYCTTCYDSLYTSCPGCGGAFRRDALRQKRPGRGRAYCSACRLLKPAAKKKAAKPAASAVMEVPWVSVTWGERPTIITWTIDPQ